MKNLGERIAIVGVTGSGKSTLALLLKNGISLPLIHTDQFIWQAGWNKPQSNDALLKYVDDILKTDRWLLEGYLGYAALPDLRLQRATSVIVLDYSRWRLCWHYFKRHLLCHGKLRPELPQICIERFSIETLKKSFSLLFDKNIRANLYNWIEHVDKRKVLIFKTPRQLQQWLQINAGDLKILL